MQYVVGIGGNLGDPRETFQQAYRLIEERIGPIVGRSSLYWSKAMLHPITPSLGQQPHLNAVLEVSSDLEPDVVLDHLMAIEELLGRVRASELVPWGPRMIDLDIVAIENQVIDTAKLTIPHPEMHKRDFVLVPMREICPKWTHPLLDKTVEELESALQNRCVIGQDDVERKVQP